VKRRRATYAASLAVVVVLLTSACTGNGERASLQTRAVDWPELRTLGISQIETDGARTWVRTLVPSENAGDLFSVERDTLSVKQFDAHLPLELIVAGEGQLWALADDGRALFFIDEATHDVRARKLDRACDLVGDPSGLVALGMLWFSCRGRISVYEPSGGAGKQVTALKRPRLLASHDGVWAFAEGVLVGIGGAAKGRHINVPGGVYTRLWKSAGDWAWALDFGAHDEVLIRVQLRSGKTSRFTIPTGGGEIDDLAVGADALWVALGDDPLVLRLDRAQPTRVLGRFDLQSEAPSDDPVVSIAAAGSYAWIEMYGDHKTKLLLARP
jgi:hypothetical protein